MLGLIRLLIITQIVRSIPLQKGLPNSADDSSSYAVGPSKDTGSKPQSDTGGPSPSNPTTGGTGPGAPSDEGTECNDVNKCFAGFVCDLKSGTGVCRKAKSCKDLTCKTGTVCQQLFGLDAQCYGTNDCTVTPCNPSQTCVSIGVPAPFCRNTLTCDDIACDIKSNCRAGSQGVDAVCIPPCADNEHWDACGGCDSSCAVPDRICNTLCNPSNGACRCNVPLVRGPDGKCIDKTQCPGGPGIPSPTPTPTEPTPSAPTPPPSPPPTEPPGPTPPPQACNLDCVIGKHCVVTPTGPMCVDNGPQACNLDCKVGFHCVVEPSGPTCVPNVPPVCNIDCKVGTHCVVEPTGPVCVPNGPQVCNIDCKIGFHCIVLPAGPTCVPNEPQVCNLDCKDGTKCVVEPTGPVCVPIEPTPVPVGSENYYGQCKAQNCPEHLQCALLFDKRMYCNSDLKCACDCEPQEVCVLEDVVCVTAPCNPVPHCYGPPEPTPPTVPTLPPSPEPTLAPSPTVPSVSPTPGPIPGPSPSPPTVPTVPPTPGPDYYDQCKAQNCPEHLQCALLPDKRMYCNLDTKCVCDCATHEVCVLEDVICVAAPCNPVPHCYGPSGPNPPTVPTLPPSPEPTLAPSPSPPVPTTGPTSGPSPSPPTAPTVPSVPPTPGPGNYYDQCKAQGCPEHLQCALLPDKRMNCNADLKCVCDCEPDHVCVLEDVVCVKAPCDPIPHCHSPNGEVTSVPTPPPTPKPPTYPLEKNYYKQCRALHCPSPQKCILEQWLELHCGISPGVKCNCAPDQLCVLQVVTCIQAPCPPIPICYSNPGKIGGPSPPPLPPPATPGPPSPIAPIDSNYYKQCKALKCPRKQECVLESWLELHCGIVPGTKCNCQPDQVCVIEVVVCCCPPCNPIAQCYSKPENPTPPPGEPTPPEKICDKHCPSGTVCLFGPGDVQKCVQETSWVTYTTLPPSSSQCKPPFPPCAPRHTCHRYPDGTQGCVEACEPPCTGGATCIPDDNGTPVCQHGTETPTNPPCHLPCPIPQTCAIDANGDPYCKGNPPCVLPCPSGEICDLNSSGKPYCKSQCDPPCSENHICRPGFEGTPICQPGFPTPTPSPTPTPTSPVPSYRPCVPPLCAPGHTCQRNKDGSQICVEQPCPLPCNPPSHVCVVTDSGPQCVEVPPPLDLPVTPIIEPIPTCAMAGLCIDGASCIDTPTGPVCAPKCSDNEEVNHCGNLCENKCASLCQPQACPKICGPPKCACKKDRYRDPKSGKCVKEKQCPKCPTTGGYPTGGTKVPPVCNILCEIGTHCEVKPTGPICVPDDKNCPKHSTYSQCGNHCEGKCATAFSGPQLCSFVCGPAACACDKDYYRNDDNECVTKDECNNNGCGPNTEPVNPCAFTTCLAPSDCIVVDGNAKCVAPGTASGHPYA